MNILLISQNGQGLGLAYRMAFEGNNVSVFIKNPDYQFTGYGIVNRVDSWRPELTKADFVICDDEGMGSYESVFKDSKIPVLGSNYITDILNRDPSKVIELCEKAHIKYPKTYNLRDASDGASLISDFPKNGYIIKARNKDGYKETVLCKDSHTYYWALTRYDDSYKVVVQEYIPGNKVTVEGWFNGVSWIVPYLLSFSDYADTSEEGSSSITGTTIIKKPKANKLITDSIIRLTPLLKKVSYRGPISMNCIVYGKDMYVVGVNPKIHYDSIEALIEGLKISATEFIYQVLTTGIAEMNITTDHLISVRIGTPYNLRKVNMPIVGVIPENMKHLFFYNVYKHIEGDGETRNPSQDQIRYVGPNSLIAKVTAHGRDITEARNRVYRTINNISFLDKRYDPNVGLYVDRTMSQLGANGFV